MTRQRLTPLISSHPIGHPAPPNLNPCAPLRLISLAYLLVACSTAQPSTLISPTAVPLATSHIATSRVPTTASLVTAAASPDQPTPVRPLAALDRLPPGAYLLTRSHSGDPEGLSVRTIEGKLVARVPNVDSAVADWDAKHDRLAFTYTYYIGILESPYLEPRELDTIPPGLAPSWAPDGVRLIYTSVTEGPEELPLGLQFLDYRNQITYPIPLSPRNVWAADWSPDDKWIAFTASETDDLSTSQVYKIDSGCLRSPEGCETSLDPITRGASLTEASCPSWSPHDAKIAFECYVEGSGFGSDICIFDMATREISTLVHTPENESMPLWSPDGEWIALETSGPKVTLVRPDGSQIHTMPNTVGEIAVGWMDTRF